MRELRCERRTAQQRELPQPLPGVPVLQARRHRPRRPGLGLPRHDAPRARRAPRRQRARAGSPVCGLRVRPSQPDCRRPSAGRRHRRGSHPCPSWNRSIQRISSLRATRSPLWKTCVSDTAFRDRGERRSSPRRTGCHQLLRQRPGRGRAARAAAPVRGPGRSARGCCSPPHRRPHISQSVVCAMSHQVSAERSSAALNCGRDANGR
jgi:hypothetical protein